MTFRALAFGLVTLAAGIASADDPADQADRHFVLKVHPLLVEKCLACHGKDETKGGFDVRSRAAVFKGGDSGEAAIVAGKPDDSPLLRAVERRDPETAMPPKENDRLTAAQIADVRKWIEAGAPWPSDERIAELQKSAEWDSAEGVPVATSGGLSPEWTNRKYKPENLWAYRPIVKPTVPTIGGGTPIDAFLNAKLQEQNVAPAPPADRATLIRRVTYDLIGLPPTPGEVDAFVSDTRSDDLAFAAVVDRLLASPHYGEHWGRKWLDVVRYADSSGFANDYDRGNAWRYRDYVIRAFNSNKPYDRFVREQIAGDEIDPDDPELLVAVGFLRMGPWELTGMEVPRIARQRFLDDVTNAVGEVFLGHALQCARCHDHKFDPVPTQDYYRLQAVFATTQLAERAAAFLPSENTNSFDERRFLEARRQGHREVLERLDEKSLSAARDWYREKGLNSDAFEREVEKARKAGGRSSVYVTARNALLRQLPDDQVPPRHAGFTPQDYGQERVARKGLERLQWELDRYQPFALSVYSGRTPQVSSVNTPQRMPADRMTRGELEPVAILAGGDVFSPTQKVAPGTLSVVDLWVDSQAFAVPEEVTGRRRALAEWLTDPRNPLTARVIVNRVWQGHFGRGLAGNPNNFGATGKKPTHPELLDWLTATFLEDGWSIKALHRKILVSDAWRRGTELVPFENGNGTSSVPQTYAAFLPRRLTAEELRDSLLAVSGELNPAVGGIPCRPEMNPDAALQPRQLMGTFGPAWQPSAKPEQRHRRSVYALKLRGLRDPFADVFNEPNPDLSCELRDASTVTPQVFTLFNSTATYHRAIAMAVRCLKEDRDQPIDHAFRLACGRLPSAEERAACQAHWTKMTERHQTLTFKKEKPPTSIVREAVEENTGEKFTFTEMLHESTEFVPDVGSADVDAITRGLAEVCLVLLNSNEFVYVY